LIFQNPNDFVGCQEKQDRGVAVRELPWYYRSTMAKACAITKKTSQVGGGYSTKVRATKFNPTGITRKYAILQKKRVFVPELNKTIPLTVSTRGLKTIQKKGAYRALKEAGIVK